MTDKLLTEHHLEFLSLKGGCTGSYVSTPVKMPHCWKSHMIGKLVLQQHMSYHHSELQYPPSLHDDIYLYKGVIWK